MLLSFLITQIKALREFLGQTVKYINETRNEYMILYGDKDSYLENTKNDEIPGYEKIIQANGENIRNADSVGNRRSESACLFRQKPSIKIRSRCGWYYGAILLLVLIVTIFILYSHMNLIYEILMLIGGITLFLIGRAIKWKHYVNDHVHYFAEQHKIYIIAQRRKYLLKYHKEYLE
jgi:hypothetical protein